MTITAPAAARTRAYWVQKRGNTAAEYEDAFASNGGTGGQWRWAIADGATEASFSRQWARGLVRAYCRGALRRDSFVGDLAVLREEWRRALARRQGTRPLPWYAQQKADLGAFAAFLGLEFTGVGGATQWCAVAVGDCNLFQVRGDDLTAVFPLVRAAQFGNSPFLVGSTVPSGGDPLDRRVMRADGALAAGDTLLLASDALSAWLLREREAGARPWRRLQALAEAGDAVAFATFVDELRANAALHNDDVTLLRIEVGQPGGRIDGDAYWLQADETTPF